MTGARRSILIVEDEYGLAEMLREMLVDEGYEVGLAINGRLALTVLAERRIDVVLTDLMMPVMDGPELATAMRATDRYQHIPVILMTSLPSAVEAPDTYAAVLHKPFTPAMLLSTLQQALQDGALP